MVDFDDVLLHVIGMTNAQVRHLLNQGIQNAEDLLLVNNATIMKLFTRTCLTMVNTMMQKCLCAFHQWVKEQEDAGIQVHFIMLTADECRCQQRKLGTKTTISTKDKKEGVKASEKFSGKQKAWKEWARISIYLAAKRGYNP